MSFSTKIAIIFALSAGALFAQVPNVTSVQNPASNIPAALPNGGIAQGSIFVIYGTNLAPPSLILAGALPLPTTTGLGGTVVTITVRGVTVTTPMVYTLDTQLAVVLPSTTPLGNGVVNVTFNGKSSPNFPIDVVASAFGISTADQTGGNAAVVTFPDYSLVTNIKPAKPGDTLLLWGTGLGAISSDDGVIPTTNIDPALSLQVWIGGVSAAIAYQGRSAAPGLDQINFVVPPGLSGCNVSLAVQTGSTLSNYTTMSISPDGATCSDVNNPTSSPLLVSLAARPGANVFAFNLNQSDDTALSGETINVQAQSTFLHFGPGELVAQTKDLSRIPSIGSCVVAINRTGSPSFGSGLDAGSSVTLTPPSGSTLTLPSLGKGFFQATPAALLPAGDYRQTNAGGADVGPLNIGFTIPSFVTWTNKTAFAGAGASIDRTKGLTVTWTGGTDANSYVLIEGDTGFGGANSNQGIQFGCAAPVSAGQFTVPPAVLMAFPPEPGGGLQVRTESGIPIAVSGLDGGLIQSSTRTSTNVSWK